MSFVQIMGVYAGVASGVAISWAIVRGPRWIRDVRWRMRHSRKI